MFLVAQKTHCLLIFLFLVTLNVTRATSFHIDCYSGNDTNTGKSDDPFLTVNAALYACKKTGMLSCIFLINCDHIVNFDPLELMSYRITFKKWKSESLGVKIDGAIKLRSLILSNTSLYFNNTFYTETFYGYKSEIINTETSQPFTFSNFKADDLTFNLNNILVVNSNIFYCRSCYNHHTIRFINFEFTLMGDFVFNSTFSSVIFSSARDNVTVIADSVKFLQSDVVLDDLDVRELSVLYTTMSFPKSSYWDFDKLEIKRSEVYFYSHFDLIGLKIGKDMILEGALFCYTGELTLTGVNTHRSSFFVDHTTFFSGNHMPFAITSFYNVSIFRVNLDMDFDVNYSMRVYLNQFNVSVMKCSNSYDVNFKNSYFENLEIYNAKVLYVQKSIIDYCSLFATSITLTNTSLPERMLVNSISLQIVDFVQSFPISIVFVQDTSIELINSQFTMDFVLSGKQLGLPIVLRIQDTSFIGSVFTFDNGAKPQSIYFSRSYFTGIDLGFFDIGYLEINQTTMTNIRCNDPVTVGAVSLVNSYVAYSDYCISTRNTVFTNNTFVEVFFGTPIANFIELKDCLFKLCVGFSMSSVSDVLVQTISNSIFEACLFTQFVVTNINENPLTLNVEDCLFISTEMDSFVSRNFMLNVIIKDTQFIEFEYETAFITIAIHNPTFQPSISFVNVTLTPKHYILNYTHQRQPLILSSLTTSLHVRNLVVDEGYEIVDVASPLIVVSRSLIIRAFDRFTLGYVFAGRAIYFVGENMNLTSVATMSAEHCFLGMLPNSNASITSGGNMVEELHMKCRNVINSPDYEFEGKCTCQDECIPQCSHVNYPEIRKGTLFLEPKALYGVSSEFIFIITHQVFNNKDLVIFDSQTAELLEFSVDESHTFGSTIPILRIKSNKVWPRNQILNLTLLQPGAPALNFEFILPPCQQGEFLAHKQYCISCPKATISNSDSTSCISDDLLPPYIEGNSITPPMGKFVEIDFEMQYYKEHRCLTQFCSDQKSFVFNYGKSTQELLETYLLEESLPSNGCSDHHHGILCLECDTLINPVYGDSFVVGKNPFNGVCDRCRSLGEILLKSFVTIIVVSLFLFYACSISNINMAVKSVLYKDVDMEYLKQQQREKGGPESLRFTFLFPILLTPFLPFVSGFGIDIACAATWLFNVTLTPLASCLIMDAMGLALVIHVYRNIRRQIGLFVFLIVYIVNFVFTWHHLLYLIRVTRLNNSDYIIIAYPNDTCSHLFCRMHYGLPFLFSLVVSIALLYRAIVKISNIGLPVLSVHRKTFFIFMVVSSLKPSPSVTSETWVTTYIMLMIALISYIFLLKIFSSQWLNNMFILNAFFCMGGIVVYVLAAYYDYSGFTYALGFTSLVLLVTYIFKLLDKKKLEDEIANLLSRDSSLLLQSPFAQ
ncbi:hypothetical protein PCE1_001796 [Barthelona sp. PCE]